MKIEINSTERIPEGFLDFVQIVSEKENLNDWKLIVWNLEGEAECINDMKLIYIAAKPDIEMMKAWFLHEVSHGTFEMKGGSEEDSIWHRKLWRIEFDRLLSCYIPNVSQETLLWLEGIEVRDETKLQNIG